MHWIRPGSVAAAGAGTGRPSHHHADATAAAVTRNKTTNLSIVFCTAVHRARTHSIGLPTRNPSQLRQHIGGGLINQVRGSPLDKRRDFGH
jgi:hypothetical protein